MSDSTCLIADCNAPAAARGWCRKHYMRWKRHGTTDDPVRRQYVPAPCVVPGCGRIADRAGLRGMCASHWSRWQRYGDAEVPLQRPARMEGPCSVEGCGRRPVAKQLCSMHYHRMAKDGDPGPAHAVNPHSLDGVSLREYVQGWLARAHRDEAGCLVLPTNQPDGRHIAVWQGRTRTVYRLVAIDKYGYDPEGLVAMHTCERGRCGCIDPDHLVFGTTLENSRRWHAYGKWIFSESYQ